MDENNCSNVCSDKCIPYFDHQNTMMHYNWANRRMLIALVTVCITFVITIVVFVSGYTQREKNWLDTLSNMNRIEVSDGEQTEP